MGHVPSLGTCSPQSPVGVQKGLDPVGGALGEVTEQQGGVPAQSAQAASSLCRLHGLKVGTWNTDRVG